MFDDLVQRQRGVLTRAQAMAAGLSRAQVEARLRSGRWRRLFLGVYVTFTGPVPRASRLWAAVLRAGPGAVLSHDTAAELAGLTEATGPDSAIHVTVPADRSPVRIAGLVIHRSTRVARCAHPSRLPPQTRVEETVVDLTQSANSVADAIGWLARAVGSRATTTDRIASSLRLRPKLRHREVLLAALGDVALGAHSLLELRYLRDVERAHGLPGSQRQVRRSAEGVLGKGPASYDDVRYPTYRTRVELDGRAAHPDHRRWRDMRRDNAAVVDGDRVLRYGTADVVASPCAVAAQVAGVLHQSGWAAPLGRCPRCSP